MSECKDLEDSLTGEVPDERDINATDLSDELDSMTLIVPHTEMMSPIALFQYLH